MAQFDVHVDRKAKHYPLLLDVQAALLTRLDTRVVVPLTPRRRYGATPITRLNPILKIRSVEYVAVFQELAAISVTELGEVHANLVGERTAIIAALDLLFTGS
jgi:toxin CcdB